MELSGNIVEINVLEGREAFFEDLYRRAFPEFARYASKMNASFDDAKDVFHDALVVYYEKSEDPEFVTKKSPEAYVLGIARHLWLKKFRRQRRHVSLEEASSGIDIADDAFAAKGEIALLNFIERSGKKCLELLNKFYYEKASLREIASWLGYRTEHSAAVQKYKCIGKIRDAIKAQSIRYEDFHI